MLVALEGPDGVGKTTLFRALRTQCTFARFVPNVPFDARLVPVIDIVQERTIALWEALYDPDRFYIADRCPFIGNVVYARVYGRPVPSYAAWWSEIRMVLLLGSARRPGDISESVYAVTRAEYATAAHECCDGGICVDTDAASEQETLDHVLAYIRSLHASHSHRVASAKRHALSR